MANETIRYNCTENDNYILYRLYDDKKVDEILVGNDEDQSAYILGIDDLMYLIISIGKDNLINLVNAIHKTIEGQ